MPNFNLNADERRAVAQCAAALGAEALVVVGFHANGDDLMWKVGTAATPATANVAHEMSDRCVRWLRALAVKS